VRIEADWPELSPPEAEHSDRLVQRIRSEIEAQGGWISFARYMEMALYQPGLGYYSAGATKFGTAGDFVTAPEISPLFSRCLAAQSAEVLQHLDARGKAGNRNADILEIGAGSGVMAAGVLNELEALDALPGTYRILEVSADLRQRQLATLADRAAKHLKRVEWLDAWPTPFRGMVLANEVLDALPVERFRIRRGEVNALGVSWQLGRLEWSEARAPVALARRVRAIEKELGESLPEGYTSEVNLRLEPWIGGLARSLSAGVMLFIDYGLPAKQYYRPERSEGTMLCHFRHRYHDDPFRYVGLQDIGAWVDFTAVANAAIRAKLEVAGFATQAHFLMGNGIDRYLGDLAHQELAERLALARQAMLLTLPAEMGEKFKVIALSRRVAATLQGFQVRDLAATL
jgi:SAM-dependent MidA family methyltransferase